MQPQNPSGLVNNIYVNGSGATQGGNLLDEKILKKIENMEQQII
jgi:hypothetical protein